MDAARTALRSIFGFDAFRPGQAEAVEAVTGPGPPRDVLVVMPTGAGKSLCYQLPALMRDDLTIVVSPLVSLMQDQVEALERVAPGRVALINAQQDAGVNRAVMARAAAGEVRLLYVAPERFSSPGFVEALRAAGVGLFVVDEAHCVSQWGHDFRPDYFRLADAARWLGAQALVASTATATPQVAADIVARLGLREPVRVTTGFDRPNLSFAVVPCRGAADKRARLAAALGQDGARPAIVYAGTRAETEDLAGALAGALGIEVIAYHAGLAREERAEAQRRFMAGEVEVVVATNAFGMGVDKADVRTVATRPCRARSRPTTRRPAAPAATGCRRARCSSPRTATRACTCSSSSARRSTTRRSRRWPARCCAPRSTGATTCRCPPRATPSPSGCARSSATSRGRAWCAPPPARSIGCAAACSAPSTDGRGRRAARRPASAARALAPVPRGVGVRRGLGVPAGGDPAPLRRPRAATGRGAVLRRLRARARPGRARAPCDVIPPTGGPPPGNLDAAIVDVVTGAEPSVGRTRTVEILRGGRSKVVRKNAYDGLPAYGTFSHLRAEEVLARVDELLDEGRLVSTGGAYPKLRVGEAA